MATVERPYARTTRDRAGAAPSSEAKRGGGRLTIADLAMGVDDTVGLLGGQILEAGAVVLI